MGETFEQRAREVVVLLAEHTSSAPAEQACLRLHSVELAIVVRALHGPNVHGLPPDAGACRQLMALIRQRVAHAPAAAGELAP